MQVAGHAYSILDAKRFNKGKQTLLKLRNPWGSFEWKGAWSDHAPEWDKNPTIKKVRLRGRGRGRPSDPNP